MSNPGTVLSRFSDVIFCPVIDRFLPYYLELEHNKNLRHSQTCGNTNMLANEDSATMNMANFGRDGHRSTFPLSTRQRDWSTVNMKTPRGTSHAAASSSDITETRSGKGMQVGNRSINASCSHMQCIDPDQVTSTLLTCSSSDFTAPRADASVLGITSSKISSCVRSTAFSSLPRSSSDKLDPAPKTVP